MTRTLTAESVTEGHPDKVADYIADSILDAYLAEDPYSRVACEALCKGTHVVIAGEITSRARVDRAAVVRAALRDVGHADPASSFHAAGIEVIDLVSAQGREIANAVGARAARELRAGDQGIMIGYATDETPERLPLPLVLAHRLAYAIGRSLPVALSVDTFGTGDAAAVGDLARAYDFRPGAIIERLRLRRPIYRLTTNYGHFGRRGLPWEEGV